MIILGNDWRISVELETFSLWQNPEDEICLQTTYPNVSCYQHVS